LVDLICIDCRARPLDALTVCRHRQFDPPQIVETLGLCGLRSKRMST
jgi:hypothetical protein